MNCVKTVVREYALPSCLNGEKVGARLGVGLFNIDGKSDDRGENQIRSVGCASFRGEEDLGLSKATRAKGQQAMPARFDGGEFELAGLEIRDRLALSGKEMFLLPDQLGIRGGWIEKDAGADRLTRMVPYGALNARDAGLELKL